MNISSDDWPDSEYWVAATAMGDYWEQEYNTLNGKWRHRPLYMGADVQVDFAWRPGRAPVTPPTEEDYLR